MADDRVHPDTHIGHVHLTVSDLERAEAFYCGILGFEKVATYGTGAIFLSFGGYHHHLALNLRHGKGAPPPPPGTTGLFHYAILYPNRRELAKAVKRVMDANWPIASYDDHSVSEAVYLKDPDGNGIELTYDRPRGAWRWENGQVQMPTRRRQLDELLAELAETPAAS